MIQSGILFPFTGWWIRQAHIGQPIQRRNIQADATTAAIWCSPSQPFHGKRSIRNVEPSSSPTFSSNGCYGTATPALDDRSTSFRTATRATARGHDSCSKPLPRRGVRRVPSGEWNAPTGQPIRSGAASLGIRYVSDVEICRNPYKMSNLRAVFHQSGQSSRLLCVAISVGFWPIGHSCVAFRFAVHWLFTID